MKTQIWLPLISSRVWSNCASVYTGTCATINMVLQYGDLRVGTEKCGHTSHETKVTRQSITTVALQYNEG